MEYFWYVIAALLAGIGTGLARLSAATVMVPILLVLCPSFYGETGAYQATAIALASDILGSAVTISTIPYVVEILLCLGKYLIFIVSAVVILLILFFAVHIRGELFRKLLHIPAFCSVVAFVFFAENWVAASMASLVFAAVIYPVLTMLEKFSWYNELFVQRRQGEVKKSLWLLFAMTFVVIAITWGGMEKSWLGVTAILMWGCGDGMAALVGKRFGKHKVHLKLADEKKSWEGTAAMMVTECFVGVISLLLLTDMVWYQAVVLALLTAPCGAYTELITHHGNDTVTVPIVNMMVLIILVHL